MAKPTKTPIMLLQELTVKKSWPPPNYELVFSQQGTHINKFEYAVCVQGQYARGAGKSKKEAKHNAATEVLKMLTESNIIEPKENENLDITQLADVSVKTPDNCIPRLMDLCVEYKIPAPQFNEISAAGAAHCREFVYECKIASITTKGTAGSKKHAKQNAAKDMLDRILDDLPQIRQIEELSQQQLPDCTDEMVVDNFLIARSHHLPSNLSLKPCNLDTWFEVKMEEERISKEEVSKFFEMPHTEETLGALLRLFNCQFSFKQLQESPIMVAIVINADFPFTVLAMGSTLSAAYSEALGKTFVFLKDLML